MAQTYSIALKERYLIDSWEYVCYQGSSFAKMLEYQLEKQANGLFKVVYDSYACVCVMPNIDSIRFGNDMYPNSGIRLEIKDKNEQETFIEINMYITFDDDCPKITFKLSDPGHNETLYKKNWNLNYNSNYSDKNRSIQVLQNEFYDIINDSNFTHLLKSALTTSNLFRAFSNI